MNTRTLAFVVVGAIGFAVQMAVVAVLTFGAHWSPPLAMAIAVEAALLTNFVWHERWTWRDRTSSASGRFGRLVRFHVGCGLTSIVGNVLLTAALVGLFHVNALVANAAAVVLLGAGNYLAADRWVFATQAAVAALVIVTVPAGTASAAELTPATIAAWNQHVAQVEGALPRHEHDAPIVEPEGLTIDVPGGAIHEWRGSILIPHTTVNQVLDALLSTAARPLQEDVALSRVLSRNGDSLRIYLQLVRRVIVTVTYDTEHDMRYERRSQAFATSRSVATRIVETGGSDRGFLWRLNSYWRYRQVGDGVQVDVLSLSLSRDVPWVVGPIARPIIDHIGRESMTRTLATVQRRAGSAGGPMLTAGLAAGR